MNVKFLSDYRKLEKRICRDWRNSVPRHIKRVAKLVTSLVAHATYMDKTNIIIPFP